MIENTKQLIRFGVLAGGLALFGAVAAHRAPGGGAAETGLPRKAPAEMPAVRVTPVGRARSTETIRLPGSVRAITEASIVARADGFVTRRLVDIGDAVKAGQTLAVIEAPELDQQVQQSKDRLEQTEAALAQASASLDRVRVAADLAKLTAQRYAKLLRVGGVSQQESDQKEAEYKTQAADIRVAEANVSAARANIKAARSNVEQLTYLQKFETVTAPFAGVVTSRSIDVGAFIGNGKTELFRLAQTEKLRIVVDVPQTSADAIVTEQPATVTVAELPGRRFLGKVARTGGALIAASRTLTAEIQLDNPDGALKAGTFAQVEIAIRRAHPAALLPGEAIVARREGPRVAVLAAEGRVHFVSVALGRDNGTAVEILSGLTGDERVIVSPPDEAREGTQVSVAPAAMELAAAPAPGGK